ncbi:hypothetical protein BN8_04395 [Fibrisoma limi BUZ 3]|uniref:Uncharacterized protein n=1 Tax=Fibrisoma limi BUZ 3 TaxID=1185876 RepID=I2GMM8_9BACT|nr:hypothetical protein [Fibrisoma limi]CCH55156.1 hypothetical protein BN8_04395 [Fibrisoma limi BUZ 3]
MRPSLFVIGLVLLALSCQPDQPPAEPPQYNVPTDIEPFVQAFRDEARQRGQSVATDNLIIRFGAVSDKDVCGECLLQSNKTPVITLSNDPLCWQQMNAQERECLVFHELGHCVLKRLHKTDRFPNGAFVSLMNLNDVSVYATCRYPIGNDDCDKRPRRSYYIDELFNPNTPAPAWAK